MTKPQRKRTATRKKREKAQFMTIFINGKQKRVRHAARIDGLDPDEFYLRNANPIALHQDGLSEWIADDEQGHTASDNANDMNMDIG